MTGGSVDFNSNIRNDALAKSPLSRKVRIEPLAKEEKVGPRFYKDAGNGEKRGPAGL